VLTVSGSTYKPQDQALIARADYQASVQISRLVASPSASRVVATGGQQPHSGGPEGPPSSSLEERTLNGDLDLRQQFSGPRYECRLKDYGDGKVLAVGVFFEEAPKYGRRAKRVVDAAAELVEDEDAERGPLDAASSSPRVLPALAAERSDRARRRARQTCRDRIWMLGADRMLTLTKRGKFRSTDEAWSAWDLFRRSARKFWGERWQFVVVPEAHREGGYHLHVALRGFFDVGMLRRLWNRALGGTGRESGPDTCGNVDITGAVSSPRSRTRIANYLAKYLGKDLGEVIRGRRALASSRGIPAPRIVRWNQVVNSGRSAVGIAQRKVRELVDARLEGLGWWEFQCGGFHGFVISPLE
jgi:hypothetical protein